MSNNVVVYNEGANGCNSYLKWNKYEFIIAIILVLICSNVMGMAEYDSEINAVVINSGASRAKGTDMGSLTIYSDRSVHIYASGWDRSAKKLISLCARDKDLGLLLLDGSLSTRKLPPQVSGVVNWTGSDKDKQIKAGWVHSFVLEKDDALDLIDMLHTYSSVGFVILSESCDEDESTKNGKIILNFDSLGLDRALNRIKEQR